MDEEEAHQRVSEFYALRRAAETTNDPASRLKLEDEAHTAWQQVEVGVVGAVRHRRYGAAMAARHEFEIGVASQEAVDAGQWEWTEAVVRTTHGPAIARRVLRQAIQDNPTLPPGLVRLACMALVQLNLGERNTWLAKPQKIPGVPGNPSRKSFCDLALLARIYYRAGFDDVPLLEAVGRELPDDAEGKKWAALERHRHRHRLLPLCQAMQATGEQDRVAGKPFSPPLAADYDVSKLETARNSGP